MDAVQAVPGIVLLLFIAVVLGPSVRNTIIALTFVIIPSFNRIARAETLRVRQEPYVEAARATGAARPADPGPAHPAEHVGLGVHPRQPDLRRGDHRRVGAELPRHRGAAADPSWGLMLSEGVRYVERAPWMIIVPAVVLVVAVFSFNLLGDALRDPSIRELQRHREARRGSGWARVISRLAPSLAKGAERIEATDAPAGGSGRASAPPR